MVRCGCAVNIRRVVDQPSVVGPTECGAPRARRVQPPAALPAGRLLAPCTPPLCLPHPPPALVVAGSCVVAVTELRSTRCGSAAVVVVVLCCSAAPGRFLAVAARTVARPRARLCWQCVAGTASVALLAAIPSHALLLLAAAVRGAVLGIDYCWLVQQGVSACRRGSVGLAGTKSVVSGKAVSDEVVSGEVVSGEVVSGEVLRSKAMTYGGTLQKFCRDPGHGTNLYHQLGRLVCESACERKDPGSNPAADMVDAARNTAWDLGKQTE
ncbi:hypothetical protein FHG87_007518 [Trinorchestia longiramus]|nr:hypothetical protein FHG87_007518 [Trinorchestia longiramus]